MSEVKPITPGALAEEIGIDPKRLRGWLRANAPRTPEAKNTSWNIAPDVADKAREALTPKAPAEA